MAEDIVLKLVLESDLAEKSIGELKQDFKDLTEQLNKSKVGTEEYKKTLSSLGVVKGGLQDLKQQIAALNPEKQFAAIARIGSTVANGFAAAQAASALFGAESEDLMKVLVKVQAATALASGLQGLSGFSKALETARLAMIAFSLSNPITAIIAGVTALAAGTILLVQSWRDANSESAKMEIAIKNLNKVYEEQKFQLDEQIRLLEAQKGKEEEIIIKKRERIIEDIKETELILFQTAAKKKQAIEEQNYIDIVSGFFSPAFAESRRLKRMLEAQQEIDDNKKKLETLKNDLTISFIDENELRTENANKQKQLLEDLKFNTTDYADSSKDAFFIVEQKSSEFGQELVEGFEQNLSIKKKSLKEILNEIDKDADKLTEKELAQAEYIKAKKIELAQQTVSAISNLTNTFFSNQLLNSKLTAKKEYEIRKRQFNFNKAVSAIEAAISTTLAIQKNYSQGGLVIGSAMNIIQAALGAISIVSILAKKFPPFEGGGADTSIPSTGGPTGAPANIESPQSQQQLTATKIRTDAEGDFIGFGGNGQRQLQPIRAYVVETDITQKQTNVRNIEERAKF